jgi:hypothetical protein
MKLFGKGSDSMPETRRFGAIPSLPDAADLPLAAAFDRLRVAAAVPPPAFARSNVGPLLNQGDTPMCVAYSAAGQQGWFDYQELGKWYGFDFAHHFRDIGGTSAGAYIRTSLSRRVNYGLPEKGWTPSDGKHRAKMFVRVAVNPSALRQALVLMPLVIGVKWPYSWMRTEPDGMLPTPGGGEAGGHAIWVPSYNGRGLIPRNSWGPWGAITPGAPKGNGNCILQWDHLDRVFEAWGVLDAPSK